MKPSLRKKIILSFLVLASINSVFAALAFLDLRYVQHRYAEAVITDDLEFMIQDMRRQEKNLFLYADPQALQDVRHMAESALNLIHANQGTLKQLIGDSQLAALQRHISGYQASLPLYAETPAEKSRVEAIRNQGRIILEQVNNLVQSERDEQKVAIKRAQRVLLISTLLLVIFMFIVAAILLHRVIYPLQAMTSDLDNIAHGRFSHLQARSHDRELVAFNNAFNNMLNELDARQRRLQHSDKLASLGVLTAGIAHELNNPLSNISSSCQLLIEDVHHASPEQLVEWAHTIDSETGRARNIVRALLNYGHRHDLQMQDLALFPLLQQTLILLRGAIRQHHAHVAMDIALNLKIVADPQRLQQIIINLIRNALDTQTDNLQIRINARIQMRQTKFPTGTLLAGNLENFAKHVSPALCLIIEDNGPGIASDVYPKIFDPFYTTHEPGKGMGLGLYIVQEIVQEHDGIIAIFSKPGEGARVVIQLPTIPANNT